MATPNGEQNHVPRKRVKCAHLLPSIRHVADSWYRLDYITSIAVLVGLEEKKFTVHARFICAKSKSIARMISMDDDQPIIDTVRLPRAQPEVFEAYLHWVYQAKIDFDSIPKPLHWVTNNTPTYYAIATYLIFAEGVLDHNLRNKLVDAAVEKCARADSAAFPAGGDLMRLIAHNTTQDSQLRALFLDIFSTDCGRVAERCTKQPLPRSEIRLPNWISNELAVRHLRAESPLRITEATSRNDICSRFHIHAAGMARGD